ncbi:MAG: entericidin A/B family lipoprotein [Oceanicaulis sp.]
MKSILTALLAGLSLLALTACNTIQGAGRDITRAGEVLEDAVDNE